MAIDPRNYDLDELRAASGASPAGGAEWPSEGDAERGADESAQSDAEAADRPAAAAAFESSVTRDLVAMDHQGGPLIGLTSPRSRRR
ncbi:hypothetical protein ACFQL0_04160 [Haloplanus litoreus]|uniref:hypothetical protein n=1 Tax=Haloplanus litoreus TaxID=767515 RepID=UPI003611DB6C